MMTPAASAPSCASCPPRAAAGAIVALALAAACGGPHRRDDRCAIPPVDERGGMVRISPLDLTPGAATAGDDAEVPYFDRPVPARILQMRPAGDDPSGEARAAAWAAWARQHGWELRRFREDDPAGWAALVPEANRGLIDAARREGLASAAADIVRWSLLARLGGVWVDRQVGPPPPAVDLRLLLPGRGLSLVSSWQGRTLGGQASSVQVDGRLIAAPAGDPVVAHLEANLAPNHRHWVASGQAPAPAFTTGDAFINLALAGAFGVIASPTLVGLGMLPPPPQGEEADPLVALPHPALAAMDAPPLRPWPLPPDAGRDQRPIPPRIHQVWYGCPQRFARSWAAGAQRWGDYAREHGWDYRLWTEADDDVLAAWAAPPVMALLRELREVRRDHRGASDLARYLILQHDGGAYFDLDLPPPRGEGAATVDLRRLLPMRGLVVVSDGHYKDFGNSALYPMNAVLLSAPGHPVLAHMLAVVVGNARHWRAAGRPHDPVFVSGPALLARSLAGPFTVVSRQLWKQAFMDPYGVPAT